MHAENASTLDQRSTERRPWESPEVTTVVPVDRTEGGVGKVIIEFGVYKVSS